MIGVLTFLFICYVLLVISLSIGFKRVLNFKISFLKPKTKFSVIIPFRNEAKNLFLLLESIKELEYPKELFEIIFVDDFSKDDSCKMINEFFTDTKNNIQVIKNHKISNSPKKDAITTAIKQANFNWIVTTDADCIVPKKWLLAFDNFIRQQQPNMVVAPVNYIIKKSFLERFQLLDFLSMQGFTIGGFGINFPFMCNGANLAYKKEVFNQLKGFIGNNHIASGDDVFLFEKFLQHDKKLVLFLKSEEVIVTTFPVKSWSALLQQRVRWASKTSQLKSVWAKLIGLLVFGVNLSLVGSFFFIVFLPHFFTVFLILFTTKFIADLFLFLPTVSFYKQEKNFIKSYSLSSLFYPFFNVFVVIKSLFFNYQWKGRSFKK